MSSSNFVIMLLVFCTLYVKAANLPTNINSKTCSFDMPDFSNEEEVWCVLGIFSCVSPDNQILSLAC